MLHLFMNVHLSGSVQTEIHIIFHIFPPEHFLSHTCLNNSEGLISFHTETQTLDRNLRYSGKYINARVRVRLSVYLLLIHVHGVFILCAK